jgi:phosphohistidine phosphatase
MVPKAAARTLWLLRHAKTVTNPPPGGADFDRVLAPRGRRDGTALGRLFAGKGEGLGPALERIPRPKVALVSPAARTRATAELAFAGMAEPPECFFYAGLYGADSHEVMAYVQELDNDADAVIIVGHNPTAHALSEGLLAPSEKKGLSLTVRTGFPTCALGVYSFKAERWADVTTGSAKLVALLVPPYSD